MGQAENIAQATWFRLQHLVPDRVLLAIRGGAHPLRAWREHLGWSEWHLAARVVDTHYAEALRQAHIEPMAAQIRAFEQEGREWSRQLVWWAKEMRLPVFFLQPWFYREAFGV